MKTSTQVVVVLLVATGCGGASVTPLPPEVAPAAVVGALASPEFAAVVATSGALFVASVRAQAVVVSACAAACDRPGSWRQVEVALLEASAGSLSMSTDDEGRMAVAWLQGAPAEVVVAQCRGLCASTENWRVQRSPAAGASQLAIATRPNGVAWLASDGDGVTSVECDDASACTSTWVAPLRAESLALSDSGQGRSALVVAGGMLHHLSCTATCTRAEAWVDTALWAVTSPDVGWIQHDRAHHVAFITPDRRLAYGNCRDDCRNPLSWVASRVSDDVTLSATIALDASDTALVWQHTATRGRWWRCSGADCRGAPSAPWQAERWLALSFNVPRRPVLLSTVAMPGGLWALRYELIPE